MSAPADWAFTIVIATLTDMTDMTDMIDMTGADGEAAIRTMLSTSHAAKDFAGRRSYACLPAASLSRG